jgi:mannose-6-phosphate isomerase-like protein (cupin superfamily)
MPRLLAETSHVESYPWGKIRWLSSAELVDGAEMTFGEVWIDAGRRNHTHAHANCEEILYVVAGRCRHDIAGELVDMRAGDSIRVPRGLPHHAVNTGEEALHLVVCYSAPNRESTVVGD